MDRIDQLAGRIPARGLTVRPTRNQRGFPRQPAVDLPLAENARNVPSDDFERGFSSPQKNQRVPVPWLTPPRKRSSTSICPFSQSVFTPAAPQTVRPPVNNRHFDAAPVRSPSLHEPTRDGHSHRGFIKHRVIPTCFELWTFR